jgi:predicted adenine nucleotide alpha hydrolase (AANH) superfamily ATPase
MYRQSYCGCVLSDVEAREERAARRADRAAEKAKRGIQGS